MLRKLPPLMGWSILTVSKPLQFTIFFCISLLTLAAKSDGQQSVPNRCYPGIACPDRAGQSYDSDDVIGPAKPDFGFTQNFVIDGGQNLLWARNLYAVGDTTKLFKDAASGNQSVRDAYSNLSENAHGSTIGGLKGWRLATKSEVDTLLDSLDATTIYAYFRPRVAQIPYRWVFATFDNEVGSQSIPVDGVDYANTSLGRLPEGRQPGSPELNPYGVWLVKEMTSDVERAMKPIKEPLRQFREPIEERRVKPLATYSVSKTDDLLNLDESSRIVATVVTRRALNSRFYTRYSLRPLPRGALVTAEVPMSALSWSGSPMPTIKVAVRSGSNQSTSVEQLWEFGGSDTVGVWQPANRARLELPEQVARNAYNVGDDLVLSFSADFNDCQFAAPELIIRYVREANILFLRQLP
ncbi:hypothetical protein Rleg2_3603 [Rhizobium leguminosarum bv. trifolii WSM2304]|uniref:DUF1566 domain-containing protein n=1 Tax=Rhizobium leguminosarum bv. trifolii (strain WSM2304) TaxID=395492 RepID=A0ABF7QSA2_RHILW|nr:hypothetical protein [Rhizobium leguminosarum]ACI56870.1 hypothetical protein Rleg2_3603 [Rhizobium leguminosarum bv. trifolii WSM2304]